MKFREVKASVVSLLAAAAAGQYRVVGYQEQDISEDEVVGTNRLVQVYANVGKFNEKSSGRGPLELDTSLRVELTVSEPAYADLTVLNDPAATPAAIATAIAAATPAASKADEALDELFELIFNVIMKGDNIDLGMQVGEMANRWLTGFEKSEPQARGDRVLISSIATLEFRTNEEVVSTDIADLDFIDVDLSIQDDGDPKAGTLEEY